MTKILVTGVNGFVGRHLARELVSQSYEPIGVGSEPEPHPEIADILTDYYHCDLTDSDQVNTLVLEGVQAIINLAGLAKVGASFDDPELYKRVNVGVVTALGNRLLHEKLPARLVAISSGALYDPHQPLPLTEQSQTAANSPYAESKLLMEQEVVAFKTKGVDAVIARPFNHIGPGQAPGFLLPDLYDKIAALPETGGHIQVGNLQTKRDYTDVRDITKAYIKLATAPSLTRDLYNICSGHSRSGQEVLDTLVAAMGMEGKVTPDVDQSLIRPTDPQDIYGSAQPLQTDTGWQPTIPFDQTVRDFVASKKP